MEELLKLLDPDLILEKYELVDNKIYIYAKSNKDEIICPYCETSSNKIHSYYVSEIKDLPIQGKETIIMLTYRKMFCKNTECAKRIFIEKFEFVQTHKNRTIRLENEIIKRSINVDPQSDSDHLNMKNEKIGKKTWLDKFLGIKIICKNSFHS